MSGLVIECVALLLIFHARSNTRESSHILANRKAVTFLRVAQVGGRTWDLFLIFVIFLSQLQRIRPLGYCAPQAKQLL